MPRTSHPCPSCRWRTGAGPARPSARTATVGGLEAGITGQLGEHVLQALPTSTLHCTHALRLPATVAVFMLFQQPNQEPIQVGQQAACQAHSWRSTQRSRDLPVDAAQSVAQGLLMCPWLTHSHPW